MKGNNSQVWHRCGTCGTIFANLRELRSHLEKHTGSKRHTSRLEPHDHTNSTESPLLDRRRDLEGRNVTHLDR